MTGHVVADHLQRGREVSVRCRCGWTSHWHPNYSQAIRQFTMHKELHP